MDADTYEQRLREQIRDARRLAVSTPFWTAVEEYAAWLRLRAVGEQPCYSAGDCGPEWCCTRELSDGCNPCPSCTAKQQIDALLAEANNV